MSNGRCRIHGGASLRGEQHPSYVHGRRSKAYFSSLPKEFRERFEAALRDPDLLSARREAAVYAARVEESLARWAAFDTSQYREDLKASWKRFEDANALPATTDEQRQAKITAVGAALTEHKQLIETGGEEAAAWQQVDDAIRSKMVAAQAEHRRLHDLNHMMTAEQALELILSLNEILQHRIQDKVLLSLIGSDIERRFGLVGPAALPDGEVIDAFDAEPTAAAEEPEDAGSDD